MWSVSHDQTRVLLAQLQCLSLLLKQFTSCRLVRWVSLPDLSVRVCAYQHEMRMQPELFQSSLHMMVCIWATSVELNLHCAEQQYVGGSVTASAL